MSDNSDRMIERIGDKIGYTYAALVVVCAALPVPVALPKGIVTSEEIIPAVRRVVEIIDEIPLPEGQQAELFTAAVLWLGAVDLYELLLHTPFEASRAASAMGILLVAVDTLKDLAAWQRENGS
ncbi:hypothetical protein [Streptomyces sp. NPDC091212]|uniref:hypothetical protein n=1 Tax=Streptomyces sp. NPDC091212 TaxID=3155191 RepID=UPI00344A5340